MQKYDFDIIIDDPETGGPRDIEQRLFEAGCQDASVSHGPNGTIRIGFDRLGACIDTTILSATDAIQATGLRIIRVDRGDS